MAAAPPSFELYRELADAYERLGQATMRDRFLMLAADAALQAGQTSEAERLRQRLLSGSRHHMLKPYSSFAEAANAPDVQTYLRDLRLNYPPEVARQMLASLQSSPEPAPAAAPTAPAPTAPPASARAVPATAPYVDVSAPAAKRAAAKPVLPETTYPLAPEVPVKPVAKPAPAAAGAPPRPAPKPAPAPAPAPAAPRRPAPAPAPVASAAPLRVDKIPAPTPSPRNGAAWFSGLLAFMVFMAGVALAAVTLGRPYLPDVLFR